MKISFFRLISYAGNLAIQWNFCLEMLTLIHFCCDSVFFSVFIAIFFSIILDSILFLSLFGWIFVMNLISAEIYLSSQTIEKYRSSHTKPQFSLGIINCS